MQCWVWYFVLLVRVLGDAYSSQDISLPLHLFFCSVCLSEFCHVLQTLNGIYYFLWRSMSYSLASYKSLYSFPNFYVCLYRTWWKYKKQEIAVEIWQNISDIQVNINQAILVMSSAMSNACDYLSICLLVFCSHFYIYNGSIFPSLNPAKIFQFNEQSQQIVRQWDRITCVVINTSNEVKCPLLWEF